MFACTAFSVESLGVPDTITPSKNEPTALLLLSPPMPRMMAPSLCIGEYPDGDVGSAPEYRVVRPPDCALPSLRAKKLVPLFFNMAVTKGAWLPVSDEFW